MFQESRILFFEESFRPEEIFPDSTVEKTPHLRTIHAEGGEISDLSESARAEASEAFIAENILPVIEQEIHAAKENFEVIYTDDGTLSAEEQQIISQNIQKLDAALTTLIEKYRARVRGSDINVQTELLTLNEALESDLNTFILTLQGYFQEHNEKTKSNPSSIKQAESNPWSGFKPQQSEPQDTPSRKSDPTAPVSNPWSGFKSQQSEPQNTPSQNTLQKDSQVRLLNFTPYVLSSENERFVVQALAKNPAEVVRQLASPESFEYEGKKISTAEKEEILIHLVINDRDKTYWSYLPERSISLHGSVQKVGNFWVTTALSPDKIVNRKLWRYSIPYPQQLQFRSASISRSGLTVEVVNTQDRTALGFISVFKFLTTGNGVQMTQQGLPLQRKVYGQGMIDLLNSASGHSVSLRWHTNRLQAILEQADNKDMKPPSLEPNVSRIPILGELERMRSQYASPDTDPIKRYDRDVEFLDRLVEYLQTKTWTPELITALKNNPAFGNILQSLSNEEKAMFGSMVDQYLAGKPIVKTSGSWGEHKNSPLVIAYPIKPNPLSATYNAEMQRRETLSFEDLLKQTTEFEGKEFTSPTYIDAQNPRHERYAVMRQYMTQHEKAFEVAWNEYKINREIITALLEKETNLGTVSLPFNAFEVLMTQLLFYHPLPNASATERERVEGFRRDIARDLTALVRFQTQNPDANGNPPSNAYAAVGIPQFRMMHIPMMQQYENGSIKSNIDSVTLDDHEDAIISTARFLRENCNLTPLVNDWEKLKHLEDVIERWRQYDLRVSPRSFDSLKSENPDFVQYIQRADPEFAARTNVVFIGSLVRKLKIYNNSDSYALGILQRAKILHEKNEKAETVEQRLARTYEEYWGKYKKNTRAIQIAHKPDTSQWANRVPILKPEVQAIMAYVLEIEPRVRFSSNVRAESERNDDPDSDHLYGYSFDITKNTWTRPGSQKSYATQNKKYLQGLERKIREKFGYPNYLYTIIHGRGANLHLHVAVRARGEDDIALDSRENPRVPRRLRGKSAQDGKIRLRDGRMINPYSTPGEIFRDAQKVRNGKKPPFAGVLFDTEKGDE